ncbi:hypothetical protein [Erwinia psidii]|uniref:Uncharacterized protein n=1 Tax=Erwinia psidii TaxID=69224 RepID=A0A3N6TTE3_9GAMM|nr:hypothetical protein [Erwinia psidii]MCX8957930.1 hypothetical protein [Erwinia psidii]MCX8960981.1 hypothetical protein [Erwinia psidii]MCX8964780.1 hypothetical protein [Erwinia psidii]RQM38542.1 hypothetical protein EB241_10020 [Erwinia psidii]
MRELSLQEVSQVNGAGVIQDTLSSVGGKIGNSLYGLISNITIEVPVLGSVSLGSILPDAGASLGSSIGSQIGGTVENLLASIPVIGSWLNSLLGN